MVERRELITICRQIGTMMEVGVDFLRLTRSLREQTDNPRLLELYNQIESDMKMGENMADSLAKSPDVFSPFAVSLIRQGEARGDIEGAWHRLADFLKQEAQQDKDLGLDEPSPSPNLVAPPIAALRSTQRTLRAAPTDWERELRRVCALGAGFLAVSALLWTAAALKAAPGAAVVPLQLALGAIFLGLAAWQGRKAPPIGVPIAPSAAELAVSETLSEEARKRSAEQLDRARDFAADFPARFSDRFEEGFQPTPGVAPEFEIDDGNEDENTTPHQEKRFQL